MTEEPQISVDPSDLVNRLSMQIAGYVVALAARDAAIEQLQKRVAELEPEPTEAPKKEEGLMPDDETDE